MPPFQPLRLLGQFRYPSTLSLFGLTRSFGSSTPANQATCTRFLPRQPSSAAPRECPTPLVLVRARGLTADARQEEREDGDWTAWSGMFAEKGYTAVEIDITAPTASTSGSASEPSAGPDSGSTSTSTIGEDADNPLPSMASVLAGQIRLMAIPFPPILISSGLSCLLTQTYVEDNPVSGLVLVDPPSESNPPVRAGYSFSWPKFKYEPRFPIFLMSGQEQVDSRLVRAAEEGVSRGGKGVSLGEMVDGKRGERSRVEVERWMDRSGF